MVKICEWYGKSPSLSTLSLTNLALAFSLEKTTTTNVYIAYGNDRAPIRLVSIFYLLRAQLKMNNQCSYSIIFRFPSDSTPASFDRINPELCTRLVPERPLPSQDHQRFERVSRTMIIMGDDLRYSKRSAQDAARQILRPAPS